MWDTELGYRLENSAIRFELVGYAMIYKDQLVPTGRLNDVGAYTRVNVERSHRMGIESAVSFSPLKKLTIEAQATISQNKIKTFNEYIDDWNTGGQEIVMHNNTDIAFSPPILAGLTGAFTLFSNAKHELSFSLANRYVGKQFADNTSREASSLQSYMLADAGINWTLHNQWAKEVRIGLMLKNAFDYTYEANGWIYRFRSEGYDPTPDDPYAGSEGSDLYHLKGYFPQAGRHLFIQLDIKF
jgi:iron complex outermembrane receptor protein